MHYWLAPVVMLALLLPAAAGAQGGRGGGATRPVAGNGVEVPGWWARLDNPDQPRQGLKFVPAGSDMHAMTGPAAIFWDPESTASDAYTVKAAFTLNKSPDGSAAYGLFIGGSSLDRQDQRYTAFLIRPDGRYLITRRSGAATSNVGGDWADHAAIVRNGGAAGPSNELSIRVAADGVTFMANGKEVVRHPVSAVDTDGVAGVRIGTGVDVRIAGFTVDQGQAAARSR